MNRNQIVPVNQSPEDKSFEQDMCDEIEKVSELDKFRDYHIEIIDIKKHGFFLRGQYRQKVSLILGGVIDNPNFLNDEILETIPVTDFIYEFVPGYTKHNMEFIIYELYENDKMIHFDADGLDEEGYHCTHVDFTFQIVLKFNMIATDIRF